MSEHFLQSESEDRRKHDLPMARMIIQGCILAGVIGIVGLLWTQRDATTEIKGQVKQLVEDNQDFKKKLGDLQVLNERITRTEERTDELARRTHELEALRKLN